VISPSQTGRCLALICVFTLAMPADGQRTDLHAPRTAQRLLAREKWQMQGRQIRGLNSAALRQHALQQKALMQAAQSNLLFSPSGWTSLGPLPLPSDASGIGLQDYGFVSGRATAVAIDPSDPSGNTVFAGGAYAGVWKSTNAGNSSANPASVAWVPLTDDQLTLAIGAIAVQPQLSNPDPTSSVVLAGTGETNSSADSYYGLGILRSSDGGQSWTLISQDASGTRSFAGLGFSQIAFSRDDPNLVVAAAASASQGILEGLENPLTVNRGLYYSTDAGITWNSSTVADSGVNIAPSSATSVVYNAAAAKFYAAIRFHGFYSSPDGANWTRLSSQPGTGLTAAACPAQTVSSSDCPIYRGEIAMVPNRAGPSALGEMYAWSVDASDGDQGIWQTLNGGASWTQINDSGIGNCGDLFGGCGTSQGAFNLAIAAVPDGTATDLYAGAVNLYKCTITNAFPTCNGTGKNSFLNLTHAYGCSDIAKVHPDQHAIDFLVANGSSLLYFANDGGIYRALDGFLGLATGTCGLINQFDSLNATLGPMTQFVSESQSATNVNLLFGGTQDNGAPATAFSQSGGVWSNVNQGDTGLTAINPTNEDEWFVATPPNSISGVNLFRCVNGANCSTQDFQNDQVVDSSQLGGDTGPFYLPFILDPALTSSILLGTCRIWRGASIGDNFSALSPDFETGGSGACTGSEVNLIRSLAAHGPKDANGFSRVIYAGTSGEGPLIPTAPVGGHVWVTTAADAGPNSWIDRTGPINPNRFPISAIALDPADPTGQTAYVSIMGFHSAHVWQTSDAGLDWTDFTANLPDAPVNSIVIDPASSGSGSTIYLGTDVGVFASGLGAPSWTEVAPAQGQPGSLPNVAVTSLRLFKSGGIKRLRAATYGRGIWEWNLITAPDFQLNVADNPQTIFAGSTAVFHGTISARNGYNSSVSLGCIGGNTSPPQTCSTSPRSLVPSSTGSAFLTTAGGSAGDYFFNEQGVGTDPATTIHNFSLTLHIVDFSLSTPSPPTVSVVPGATTSPVSFIVSAAGAFNSPVTLSCAGLPLGASCSFQPSNVVAPISTNPVAVILNVSTLTSTALGSSNVTISASVPGGTTKTQSLTLIVGPPPDYTLVITNPSLTTQVNKTAVFSGTLTALNGYSNPVTLSCGTGAPPQCVAGPGSLTPSASGMPFTVSASSTISKSYSFNINAVGGDLAAITHSAAVTLTVMPTQSFDFTLGVNPQADSVPVGKSTTFTVDVNPVTGSFPSAVTFSCSKLPNLTTCSFSPVQVGPGSGNSAVALTIATTGPSPATSSLLLMSLPLAGLFWMSMRPRRLSRRSCGTFAIVLLALLCSSCGGGLQGNGTNGGGSGNPGTPKATYNITVTASCAAVSHSQQVSLTVQ
jgi:hypothetical protein